jgi:hypothetical protein
VPTVKPINLFLISLMIVFSLNHQTFAASISTEEIVMPRVDLTPKGPCPVAPSSKIPSPSAKKTESAASLANFTASFKKPYDKVFITAVSTLEKSPITVVSFDTASGRIFCNYRETKSIYGVVESTSSNSTVFRITPADGNYNIPLTIIKSIFQEMEQELSVKED